MEILRNTQIRRYIPEDYPKLLELIRAVYNEGVYKKAVSRFQWQYEQNPNNSPEDPVIFVLEDDDKIIGMVGAFAQKLKIGDTISPAYWVGDFMVHPDFRNSLNGTKLARMISVQPGLMMGFPVENTVKLWFRAQWSQFGQLVEYSRNTRFYDRLVDSLWYKSPKEIQIIDVKSFDQRFDRLWEKASGNYKNLQVRDSSFLNWRFIKCPHIPYRILAAAPKNEILGYIVIRDINYNGYHEGIIVDIFTDRSDRNILKTLMHAGIRALRTAGCDAIKMTVSSDDKILNKILRQNFFISKKKERGIFINNTSNVLNQIIQGSNDWFLTKADSDIDFT